MGEVTLPKQWLKTTLGTVVDYGKVIKASPVDVHDDTWVLELEDIEKDSSKLLNKVLFRERKFKSIKNRFKAGDVLYGKLRPYLNKVIVAREEGVCTTEILPLSGSRNIDNYFLFYWLKSSEYLTYVTRVGYGVNMPRLGTKDGIEAPFILPPLHEQQEIAKQLDELLGQVDTLKSRLDAIPSILKRFRQSTLAAAVSGKLTEQWRNANRFQITQNDYYEAVQKSGFKIKAKGLPKPHKVSTTGWLGVNLGHVFSVKSGDGLTANNMNSVGDVPVYGGNGVTGYHDKSNVHDKTIVIGRVGFYCGAVHMTPSEAWITDNALIVSFSELLIEKEFAYWLLLATNLRVDAASSAQPVISGTKIYPIQLSLPPVEEQIEIARRVKELFTFTDQVEQRVSAALARVNHLTQAILAKAFRGELTANWRAANPDLVTGENSAETLLKHIKEERELSAAKKRNAKSSLVKKPQPSDIPSADLTQKSRGNTHKDSSRQKDKVRIVTLGVGFEKEIYKKFAGKSFTSEDLSKWQPSKEIEYKRSMVFKALGKPLDGSPVKSFLKMKYNKKMGGYIFEFTREAKK